MNDIKRVWLKPADGLLVRFEDPTRGYIPPEGASLPMTSYYRRRMTEGDLVKGKPQATKNTPNKGG